VNRAKLNRPPRGPGRFIVPNYQTVRPIAGQASALRFRLTRVAAKAPKEAGRLAARARTEEARWNADVSTSR